ncbi:hypothetical protein [Aurantimonas marina]|uniref:hypothetical protein n=1 Tax=Aurantimonas marina TaxID=2780508 RepID=UPI0019D13C2D|nr:hypothetical protein [Aurantimonas marina]
MPHLFRFLARNALIGFCAAAFFVAVLALADIGGFGTVIARSDSGSLAIGLVIYFLGLTFSSVQIGMVIMLNGRFPDDDEGPKGGKRKRLAGWLSPPAARSPIMVPAPAPRPRRPLRG